MCELPIKLAVPGEFKEPARIRIPVVKTLLLVLSLLVLFDSPTLGSQPSERKKILVLFSFRPTLPVASQWNRGIRSVFDANKALETIINIEHLDLTHFNDEHHV